MFKEEIVENIDATKSAKMDITLALNFMRAYIRHAITGNKMDKEKINYAYIHYNIL